MTERYNNVMEILDILKNSNINPKITKMYNRLSEKDNIEVEEIYQINDFLYQFKEDHIHSDIVNYAIELLKSLVTCNNLIVTHNGRMRCILYDILLSVNINVNSRVKFKNCSIVRLKFRREYEMIYSSLRCIYNGEITDYEKEGEYFDTNEIDYKFNDSDTRRILAKLNILPEDIEGEINFFIVRHGEGFHNTVGLFGKAIGVLSGDTQDALLSEEGYKQALNAGKFMESYLLENQIYINNLFCSDLRRTMQTLGYMLLNMHHTLSDVNEIVVLPCSHELDPKEGGNCDARQLPFTAPENQTSCKITEYDSDLQCESLSCYVYNNKTRIPVNWKHYLDFYGGHQRGVISIFGPECECHTTSLFSIALGIIQKTKLSVWINMRK